LETLLLLTHGSYQLKQSLSYVSQHFSGAKKSNFIEICREEPDLIRARIISRHRSQVKYLCYVRFISNEVNNKDCITGYVCRCMSGMRTVGMCAHITSIIYWFCYGRYMDDHNPAAHLSHIFPESAPIRDLYEESDDEFEQSVMELMQEEEQRAIPIDWDAELGLEEIEGEMDWTNTEDD
jgi:hypothetical protein